MCEHGGVLPSSAQPSRIAIGGREVRCRAQPAGARSSEGVRPGRRSRSPLAPGRDRWSRLIADAEASILRGRGWGRTEGTRARRRCRRARSPAGPTPSRAPASAPRWRPSTRTRRPHRERRPSSPDTSARCREPDHDRPREGDGEPASSFAREALAKHDAGEHGDQNRSDVDEHRGRAGVHPPLRFVQRNVVDPEPEDPAEDDGRQVPPAGQRLAPASTNAPSAALPTSSRPSAIEPGESSWPGGADPENAEAQSVTRPAEPKDSSQRETARSIFVSARRSRTPEPRGAVMPDR